MLSRIYAYDRKCEQLAFEDIDRAWLNGFDAFLAKTSPSANARAIHLRNIRAVFNDAIDDEITHAYPFRKYKIKRVATPKRSLSVEELRQLFAYPVEEYQRKYLDVFKLIFFLIGINIGDLCKLKRIDNGRIEYERAKTHRLYSVKVEPEAMEIIERLKGKNWLIDPLDTCAKYKDYAKRLNLALQSIGEVQSLAEVVVILRTPRSMSNKESTLAEMMLRKDAHLSDMLANNNKLIDELCKQNERTGRMIDKLIEK